MQPETFFVVPRGEDDGQGGVALRHRGAVQRRSDLPQPPVPPMLGDYSSLASSLGEHKAVLLGCLHALSMAAERDALTFDVALQVSGAAAQAQRDKCMTMAVASRSAALRLLKQPSPARRASTTEQELCAEFEELHHCIETLLTQESMLQNIPPVQLPGICCRTRPRADAAATADHADADETLSGLVYAPHTSSNRSLALWAEALVVYGMWLGVFSLTVAPILLPQMSGYPLVAGTSLPECALFFALASVATGVLANLYLTAQRVRAIKTPPVSTGNGGRTLSYNVALQPTSWWQRQVQSSFRRYVTVSELVRQWHAAQAAHPGRGMQRSGSEDSVSGPMADSPFHDGPFDLRLDEPMPPQHDGSPPSPRSLTPPLGPLTAANVPDSQSSLYHSSGGHSAASAGSAPPPIPPPGLHRRHSSRNSSCSVFSTTEEMLQSMDSAVLATRDKTSLSVSSMSSGCTAPLGDAASSGGGSAADAAARAATTTAAFLSSESDDEDDADGMGRHSASVGSESDEDPEPSPLHRGQRGAQRGGVQGGVHLLTPLHL